MAQIKIDDIGGLSKKVVEGVVKETTMALLAVMQQKQAKSSGGEGTPVDTGVLIGGWQSEMDGPLKGTVFNNIEYAAPVIAGENLPPSWKGQYRTAQGTIENYPDLIAKEVATRDVPKIVKDVQRRLG